MGTESHDLKKQAIAEINRLVKSGGGRITPRALVEAARGEESALHDYFEWDDSEAAEKYREMQARALLRSCTRREVIEHRKIDIPMYVRDPDADATVQGYIESTKIRTDSDAAREVLVSEFKRAASLIRRAKDLSRYFDLGEDFDGFISAMDILGSRIAERTGANLNA